MRWIVLVALALLVAAPAQALSHNDGENDVDVTVDNDGMDGRETANETVGAGRDEGGDGINTPWAILMVLGVLVVVAVVAALFFAARNR